MKILYIESPFKEKISHQYLKVPNVMATLESKSGICLVSENAADLAQNLPAANENQCRF